MLSSILDNILKVFKYDKDEMSQPLDQLLKQTSIKKFKLKSLLKNCSSLNQLHDRSAVELCCDWLVIKCRITASYLIYSTYIIHHAVSQRIEQILI